MTVSHLDEQEDCRGGVKGSVVDSDDGGAVGAKQVSYLLGIKNNNNRGDHNRQILQQCKVTVWLSSELINAELSRMFDCENVSKTK